MKYFVLIVLKSLLVINLIQIVKSKCAMCPMSYIPVCASNGLIYSNKYCMKCNDPTLTVIHNGECSEEVNLMMKPYPIAIYKWSQEFDDKFIVDDRPIPELDEMV